MIELSVNGLNQSGFHRAKVYLDLKIDSADITSLQHVRPNHLLESEVKHWDGTLLLIDVDINGKQYTLQCKKTKPYLREESKIITEMEQMAQILTKHISTYDVISNSFPDLYGHGRVWFFTVQTDEIEMWEALLIENIIYINLKSFTGDSFYKLMSIAFIQLNALHSNTHPCVLGHPKIDHLATKHKKPQGGTTKIRLFGWNILIFKKFQNYPRL